MTICSSAEDNICQIWRMSRDIYAGSTGAEDGVGTGGAMLADDEVEIQ